MLPEDLATHDGITFQGFSSADGWSFEQDGRGFVVQPRSRLTLNHSEAAIDAAVDGLGIVRVLSYQITKKLQSGALVEVLKPFSPQPTPVRVVYARRGRLPLKVRAFVDLAADRLRKQLVE